MNKKLVIYSAANAHGYITCITHRLLYNSTAKAVIVLDKYVPNIGKIYFDDYIPFPRTTADGGPLNWLSAAELEAYIINYFNNKFSGIGISPDAADEIFTGSYWSDFPLYLNLKKIKHNIFQEAVGDVCFPMHDYIKRTYPALFAVQEKAGIYKYLDNENIINAYFHKDTIAKVNYHHKCIEFNINTEIYQLPEYMRISLLNTYNLPTQFASHENNALVLTQWWANNGVSWTGGEPVKMFSLLCDMYGKGTQNKEVYFKKHPADKNDYRPYLKGVKFLNDKFPSEMLGLIKNIHFDHSVTISSSSINSVKIISSYIYSIKDFKIFYPRMIRIYMALYLMRELKCKLFYNGVFSEEIQPLLKLNKKILPDSIDWFSFADRDSCSTKCGILINDYLWRKGQAAISLSEIDKALPHAVSFIVTDNIENYIQSHNDNNLKDYLYYVKISTRKIREDSIFENCDERIYIYTMNTEFLNLIFKFEGNVIFNISGILCEISDIVKF